MAADARAIDGDVADLGQADGVLDRARAEVAEDRLPLPLLGAAVDAGDLEQVHVLAKRVNVVREDDNLHAREKAH